MEKEQHKKTLYNQLWEVANTLRQRVNSNEYKEYILGFIFYKYLSEKMEKKANDILKRDGITFKALDENTPQGKKRIADVGESCVSSLGYFLKPTELLSWLVAKGNGKTQKTRNNHKSDGSTFILEDLQNILTNIGNRTLGKESEHNFDHLFDDIDLTSTKIAKLPNDRNDIIVKILTSLDSIDFCIENDGDVLGDAYEYLIAQFAESAGKKAGEFYTPKQLSTILAKIVTSHKKTLHSVYDPTCGSGSLLLQVKKEAIHVEKFYAQESNRTTYNLARMNMILHGVKYPHFDIKHEDTLERPQHLDEEKFNAIVANPPFSAKWSANPIFHNDDRFSSYGRLAPKSKADFAFIQHMIHHLDESGMMACVVPHGVLFRGGAEKHIRQYLIEDKNYLDAVIGLPPNLFYGTNIPACILVFKKCKETDHILFIDASREFEKNKNKNNLTPAHIEKIVTTYQQYKSIDQYAHVATLATIKDNDYNLNISLYIDATVEEEPIDIAFIASQLQDLEQDINKVDAKLATFCQELQIKPPF